MNCVINNDIKSIAPSARLANNGDQNKSKFANLLLSPAAGDASEVNALDNAEKDQLSVMNFLKMDAADKNSNAKAPLDKLQKLLVSFTEYGNHLDTKEPVAPENALKVVGIESVRSQIPTEPLVFVAQDQVSADQKTFNQPNSSGLSHSILNDRLSNSPLSLPQFTNLEPQLPEVEFVRSQLSYQTLQISSSEIVTNELYDQKWYSVGKLSYLSSNNLFEKINSVRSSNIPFETTIQPPRHIESANKIDSVPAKQINNVALVEVMEKNINFSIQNKSDKKPMPLTAQLLSDIEKRRLSVIKDGDEKVLVVRDYTSNNLTIWSHIKSFIGQGKGSISKITINGKEG